MDVSLVRQFVKDILINNLSEERRQYFDGGGIMDKQTNFQEHGLTLENLQKWVICRHKAGSFTIILTGVCRFS